MPLAITPTFRRWTHTSGDSYTYQLSLVVATATVSVIIRECVHWVRSTSPFLSLLSSFLPIHYLRFFFSLPPIIYIVVTQIWGHVSGSCPPSRLRFVPCIFMARSFYLSLPSSTCCVTLYLPPMGAHPTVGPFLISCKYTQKLTTAGIRTHGPTQKNSRSIVRTRGWLLHHRATGSLYELVQSIEWNTTLKCTFGFQFCEFWPERLDGDTSRYCIVQFCLSHLWGGTIPPFNFFVLFCYLFSIFLRFCLFVSLFSSLWNCIINIAARWIIQINIVICFCVDCGIF